jgi:hypothetical protein
MYLFIKILDFLRKSFKALKSLCHSEQSEKSGVFDGNISDSSQAQNDN